MGGTVTLGVDIQLCSEAILASLEPWYPNLTLTFPGRC